MAAGVSRPLDDGSPVNGDRKNREPDGSGHHRVARKGRSANMTTKTDRPKQTTLQRGLLVGVLVFLTMFPARLYLVPFNSALDGPLPTALMAAALASGAWWVVFRWWRP